MTAQTTMGTLANWKPPATEERFLQNVVRILDEFYPDNWRAWVVNALSFEGIFGSETISPDLEGRLRFAIPTVKMAEAFECTSLSERQFKKIKRVLLSWPLGRALIYAPLTIMAKIHPVHAYNKFAEAITTIKADLIARHEAASILKLNPEEDMEAQSSSSAGGSKRCHSPDPPSPRKTSKLDNVIAQQNLMFEKLCYMVESTNQSINQMMMKQNQSGSPGYSQGSSPASGPEDYVDFVNEDNWKAPSFINEDSDENEPVLEPNEEEVFENFDPGTKETEGKISKAGDAFVKQGISCQRFNTEGWQNIRYADVQKMFQASPAFSALKVNGNLASTTPSWQLVSAFEKMDSCLGAITHGLLQQRDTFQVIYQNATPQVKSFISKNLLAAESPFRKTSDALLQYTCGKRAEIISQRRNIYKPVNKTLNELLHSIPPSEHYLFAEPQLSEFVKEQGGVSKLFPGKFRKVTVTTHANRTANRRPQTGRTTESVQGERPKNYRIVPPTTTNRKTERPRYKAKYTPAKQNKHRKY